MKKLLLGTAATLAAAAVWLFLALQAPGTRDLPTIHWDSEDEIPIVGDALIALGEREPGEDPERSAVEEGDAGVRIEAALHGRIVDLGGAPIAGAEVCLQYREASSNRNRRRVQKHVLSGEDGTFAFVGSVYNRNLIVNLQVTHDNHAPTLAERRVEQVEGAVDLGDIPMPGGGIVVGRVTDFAGNAIPGARIALDPERRNGLDDAHDRDRILAAAESDGNGFFSLEHLMAGDYSVDVSARHRQGARKGRFTVEDAREVDLGEIPLGPGYEIVGVVYTEEGAPVERAQVRVASSARGRPDFSTRTDDKGLFTVDHVPPGSAQLLVKAQGFLDNGVEDIDPANTTPLTIRLHEAMQIRGQVVDAATGGPVTSFAVRARRLQDLPEVRLDAARSRAEDRMGALNQQLTRLLEVGGGSNEVRAAEMERELAALQARMSSEDRRLSQALQQTGDTPSWPEDAGKVRDYEDGRFQLTDLAEGVYAVDVQAPDHQRFRSELLELRRTDPVPEITVVLPRGVTISGQVIARADGEPIGQARVRLTIVTQDSGGRVRERNGMSARTDADGRFSLGNLPPGLMYSVNAQASGHLPEKTEPFLLEGDLDGLELSLGGTGALEGQVVGLEAGERVSVVAVSVGDGRAKTGRTQDDGTYSLRDLAPGSYAVRAYGRNVNSRILRALTFAPDVEVRPGETLRHDLPLSERPTGVLTGTVLDNSQPGVRYRVRLQAEAGNRSSSSTAGGDGRFRFQDVIPGHYSLIVQGPTRRNELHREPVFVGGSSETDLAVRLSSGSLRGTVTAGDGVEPSGRVWLVPGITQIPADLQSLLQANPGRRVDVREGAFDFGRLSPGFYLVIVDAAGFGLTAQQVRVTAASEAVLQVPVGR